MEEETLVKFLFGYFCHELGGLSREEVKQLRKALKKKQREKGRNEKS